MRIALAVALVLAATAVIFLIARASGDAARGLPDDPRVATVVPIDEVAPPAPLQAAIVMPDGSRFAGPPGLEQDVQVEWDRPRFPPVVSKQIEPDGVEWFVHEDGSYSRFVPGGPDGRDAVAILHPTSMKPAAAGTSGR